MKHCIDIISHSILCIVFEIIYINHMYSYLFIYIYVLQVYTLMGVLNLIYLTCCGSCIVVIHICMPSEIIQWCCTCVGYLQRYMWYFLTNFCCMSMWFTPWNVVCYSFLILNVYFFTYLYRYYKVFIMHIYCYMMCFYIYVCGCFSHHKWYSRYIL